MPLDTFRQMKKPAPALLAKGLTFAQFGLIAVLFALGPAVVAQSYAMAAIQLLGLALGLYGIYTIGVRNFSAYPTPRKGSMLVCSGPYKRIRHPMYLAVILYCAPIALFRPTPAKTLTALLLLVVLLVKIRAEERFLSSRYSSYREYKRQSWRLIPFLY